jgi:DNA-binding NarL/FixJ family response regulator
MAITVLLADDHGVLRDGVRRLLEARSNINVVATATDGLDAIGQAQRLAPDVAVLDIAMPRLNGLEATRSIIRRAPTTGVVILSMHSSGDLIRLAFAAGARGYVPKESVGDELVAAIHAVATGGVYLGQGVAVSGLDIDRSVHDTPPALKDLTEVERDILKLVADGKSNAETARQLHLSPRTVETYRSRIMQRLQLADLPALVKFAIRHGLTSLG